MRHHTQSVLKTESSSEQIQQRKWGFHHTNRDGDEAQSDVNEKPATVYNHTFRMFVFSFYQHEPTTKHEQQKGVRQENHLSDQGRKNETLEQSDDVASRFSRI